MLLAEVTIWAPNEELNFDPKADINVKIKIKEKRK
jgi:hypothetical protein